MTSLICETCHEPIDRFEDGWLEWFYVDHENGHRLYDGFRICHHITESPWQSKGGCYQYDNHPRRQDNHLNNYAGRIGLAHVVKLVMHTVRRPDNLRAFVELAKSGLFDGDIVGHS